MEHHSVFDYIARDDNSHVVAGRQALSLANKRVNERFGAFLAGSGGATARLELIHDDFNAVIAAACEEVGHADVAGLTAILWNDHVSRISGENPFAKKDDDDDDKCDCKGDEECAKCKKEKKEKKDDDKNPFAKKDSSRTASVHEARKPKLCPYHGEVMNIGLTSGDPTAGYNAMASHAWSAKHCQGDEYEGNKCNFKPEMTTQNYWDTKAEKAEERKRERAEQVEVTDVVPNGEFDAELPDTDLDTEPVADASTEIVSEPDSEGMDQGGEAGLPEEELMAIAASTQRFIPLVSKVAYGDPRSTFDRQMDSFGERNHHTYPEDQPPEGHPWHYLAPMTQKGIAAELQSMETQGMSRKKALQMLAERHGLSEEQIYSMAERHNAPSTISPSTDQFFDEMRQHRATERQAEALEQQDVTKNTHPEFTKEHSNETGPTDDAEMEGTPHPTKHVDIQPDITVERRNPTNEDKLEDIGENTTEHQDVTQKSDFSNKYPDRWASVDKAIANFNGPMTMSAAGINSVRSNHGHQFIGEDEGESCLTCGAHYVLRPTPDEPNDGAYQTNGGDEPTECSRDTSMVHGYPGERHCDACDNAGCKHCEHNCNCLLCDS